MTGDGLAHLLKIQRHQIRIFQLSQEFFCRMEGFLGFGSCRIFRIADFMEKGGYIADIIDSLAESFPGNGVDDAVASRVS